MLLAGGNHALIFVLHAFYIMVGFVPWTKMYEDMWTYKNTGYMSVDG
jgi:hypothetical protein